MAIKIIASDMDGTLLNSKASVTVQNRIAIQKAQKAGIQFVVATGRTRAEVQPLFDSLQVQPAFITLNGALVYDQKLQPIIKIPLEKTTLHQSIAAITKMQLYFEIVTDHGVYTTQRLQRMRHVTHNLKYVNPSIIYKSWMKTSSKQPQLLQVHYIKDYQQLLLDPSIQVLKILTFNYKQDNKLAYLRNKLQKIPDIAVTSSGSNNLEINHYQAQKGIALAKFAKMQNVNTDQVMAIGDNLNDESMIRTAGIGVAMGNALPEIKQIAQYQTTTNDQSGVAKAINYALSLS